MSFFFFLSRLFHVLKTLCVEKSICFVSFHSTQCVSFFSASSSQAHFEVQKTWIYELSLSQIPMHDLQMLNVPFILKHLLFFFLSLKWKSKNKNNVFQKDTKQFFIQQQWQQTAHGFHCAALCWNRTISNSRELSRTVGLHEFLIAFNDDSWSCSYQVKWTSCCFDTSTHTVQCVHTYGT